MPILINGQNELAGQLINIISKKVGKIFYESWVIFLVLIK